MASIAILENVVMARKAGLSEAAMKRVKAGLLLAGKVCVEVAFAVGVARQTPYTWRRLLDEGGIDASRGVPERGRSARFDKQQLASARSAVSQNPTEHGFGTELWTLKPVGADIEHQHGVRFSQTQTWRILDVMRKACAPGNAGLGPLLISLIATSWFCLRLATGGRRRPAPTIGRRCRP